MSKRIKQIDNENIKIEVWKEPDVVFDTDLTLNDTICLFREVINPFEMYKENIRLKQDNKELKEKIKHADEFCDRYMSVRLELFDMYELLNKIREILGDKE